MFLTSRLFVGKCVGRSNNLGNYDYPNYGGGGLGYNNRNYPNIPSGQINPFPNYGSGRNPSLG
jgi:hypothetical protein